MDFNTFLYYLYWFLNEVFDHYAILWLWGSTFYNLFLYLLEICKYIGLVLYYNFLFVRVLCYLYVFLLWFICITLLIYDFYIFIKLYYKIYIKKQV